MPDAIMAFWLLHAPVLSVLLGGAQGIAQDVPAPAAEGQEAVPAQPAPAPPGAAYTPRSP